MIYFGEDVVKQGTRTLSVAFLYPSYLLADGEGLQTDMGRGGLKIFKEVGWDRKLKRGLRIENIFMKPPSYPL